MPIRHQVNVLLGLFLMAVPVAAQTAGSPADAYVALAEAAFEERDGPERGRWSQRIAAEDAALRSAFDQLVATGDADRALRLTLSVEPYWLEAGRIADLREQYRRALGLSAPDGDPQLRERALFAAGVLAMEQRDLEPSGRYLREALQLARVRSDRPGEARALLGLARLAMRTEDHAELRSRAAEAARIYRELDHELGVASAEHVLGNSAMMTEAYADAVAHFERALDVYRRRGMEGNVSVELFNIGSNEIHRGRLDRAKELLAESLRIMRRRDARSAWAYPVLGFGWIAAGEGELDRAAVLFGAVDADMERQERALDPAERLHHQHYLEQVRRQLTADRFEKAWRRGRAMSIDEAVDYALDHHRR